MSLAAKRRLLAALLLVLALWPFAHRALVARYRLTPWRFFGWAMYCTPKLPVRVSLERVAADGRTRLAVAGSEHQALRRAVLGFSRRRGVWGTLLEPDGIATLGFAAYPDAEAIEIEVEHLFLNPDTARIDSARYAYPYSRPRAGD